MTRHQNARSANAWIYSIIATLLMATGLVSCGGDGPLDIDDERRVGDHHPSETTTDEALDEIATLVGPIVAGNPTSDYETVGIVNGGCSGTLVGAKHVLTAGHCIGSPSASFSLAGKRYSGSAVIYGGRWNFREDVALISLSQEVSGVTPTPLATVPPTSGQPIAIVGYGITGTGRRDFGTLRETTNEVSRITETLLVYTGTGSACNGDSGGPVFSEAGGKRVIVGITSSGTRVCGQGQSNAMRVDAFVSWLLDQAPAGSLELDSQSPNPPTTPPGNPPPPSTPPQPPGADMADEGQSCQSRGCKDGLACIPVWRRGGGMVGKYCMEKCDQPGHDPACNGGEVCTTSRSLGINVCVNVNNPANGYTDPDDSQTPPAGGNPPAPPAVSPPSGGVDESPGAEGETCISNACEATFQCTPVYSSRGRQLGAFCMEPCGGDQDCDSGERCARSTTTGKSVCFNSRAPDNGYTS